MSIRNHIQLSYGGHGAGSHYQKGPKVTQIPDFNLGSADGPVPDNLYDEIAEDIAKGLVDKSGRQGVSRHQLRRLFDEVKRLKRRVDNSQSGDSADAWEKTLPLIKLVKSKTAYMVARGKDRGSDAPYYENLRRFINQGIGDVEETVQFERFVNLFEAVYGYYYALGGAKRQ